jgi:hypothetical protein
MSIKDIKYYEEKINFIYDTLYLLLSPSIQNDIDCKYKNKDNTTFLEGTKYERCICLDIANKPKCNQYVELYNLKVNGNVFYICFNLETLSYSKVVPEVNTIINENSLFQYESKSWDEFVSILLDDLERNYTITQ